MQSHNVKGNRILIVDDDVAICRTLQLHLLGQGYEVTTAHGVDEGLTAALANTPDLVVLDIRMPGKSGLDGLPEFKSACTGTHMVMITAFQDMDSTIQAMQRGADDYIHKPIDIEELDEVVKRILSPGNKQIVQTYSEKEFADTNTMAGRGRAMKEVFKTIGLAANSPVTVLITGESGTGKELVARAIHRVGPNPNAPFVAVNCAALVETLLESDMFGHEKGAFTGAVNRQPGKFALAGDGVIFLDELSELSPSMQAKLLRVLQEKEFTPLGGKEPQKTHARVIAATNANLAERVRGGKFREDLYYRLRVVTIKLPPLRERKEDIMDLVQVLLSRINRQMNRDVTQVSKEVFDCLENYDWPGNVRELENILAKAVALCPGKLITRDLISDIVDQAVADAETDKRPLTQWSLEEVDRQHVLLVLEGTRWHRGRTCEILGVSRPRLRRLIKHFNFVIPVHADFEDGDSDEQN
ncbi:MAG: sigma-54-dependent Fis family transcriptional regulator [Nitrosomonadales bacterium]|nr:sigma-54-dependent Fis family transcriptional regulator [Nitrosomonadales bacterium]